MNGTLQTQAINLENMYCNISLELKDHDGVNDDDNLLNLNECIQMY